MEWTVEKKACASRHHKSRYYKPTRCMHTTSPTSPSSVTTKPNASRHLRARQYEPPSVRTTYMQYARLTYIITRFLSHNFISNQRLRDQISLMRRDATIAKQSAGLAPCNGTSPASFRSGECRSKREMGG